jgi:hypothetical protein
MSATDWSALIVAAAMLVYLFGVLLRSGSGR